MSDKSEQLKKLIEAVVRKEVRALVPQIVKEVMAGMIMEARVSTPTTSTTPAYGNSDKRRSLLEQAPSMDISDMVGWEGEDMPMTTKGLNLPAGAFVGGAESPQPVPIHPSQVPDAVIRAMNTDYRPLLESLKKRGLGNG